jgi:hypothetical protein
VLLHLLPAVVLLLLAGGRQLRVTAPLSAKDTLDLQDAHREALALIEAASMGVGGFMGGLSASALASTAAGGPGGAAAGQQRSSLAMAAASLVARQERALKWSQGVLARALETREATFRCGQQHARPALPCCNWHCTLGVKPFVPKVTVSDEWAQLW